MLIILNLLGVTLIGSTAAKNGTPKNVTIAAPLKNLSNFWRSL